MHIEKAFERQEPSVCNVKRSRKGSSSRLLLDMALRNHKEQQEQLAVHTIGKLLSVITIVSSEAREKAKISILTKMNTYVLTGRSWIEPSLKHLSSYFGTTKIFWIISSI